MGEFAMPDAFFEPSSDEILGCSAGKNRCELLIQRLVILTPDDAIAQYAGRVLW